MNDLKLHKRSDLSKYEMDNRTFDDRKDAWRVSIIDGVTLNVDNINIPKDAFEQKSSSMQVVTVPEIIKQAEIHQVNVPVIVREYEKIGIPTIIKEYEKIEIEKPIIITEYKTIEIPVIVPEIRIVEIEKHIVTKETEYKELPIFVKACIVVQAIATVGLLITHIILKG